MAITYIDGIVRGPEGKEENLSFLVDSGATYSLLPAPVWESIGLVPTRQQSFTLAEGTTIQRNISECFLTLSQGATSALFATT